MSSTAGIDVALGGMEVAGCASFVVTRGRTSGSGYSGLGLRSITISSTGINRSSGTGVEQRVGFAVLVAVGMTVGAAVEVAVGIAVANLVAALEEVTTGMSVVIVSSVGHVLLTWLVLQDKVTIAATEIARSRFMVSKVGFTITADHLQSQGCGARSPP